ncbi:class I adenylate-forming enzyme family protein [Amycolatopsis benzoatilytica]|uniref:class I adenylate-forming enzyme family protein n=1 Tax=Amycolatopsis benzoatilytica TaxID=346045 RepID=UPI00037A26E5|nr:AMP-binding protein [Amycolatopsis benzoatilytica]
MSATVGAALAWWAANTPEAAAFVFEEETLDYATAEAWSSRIAQHLRAEGVREGDRVGLFAPNSVPWPVAALGVVKAGAVLVPLNSRFKAAELRKVLADAGADVVIADDALKGVVDEASTRGGPVTVVPFSAVDVLRAGPETSFRVDRAEDEPIAIIFTSGSTGRSKGVVLTNRTLLSIVFEATLVEAGFHRGSSTLLVLPLAFTPGLVWGLLMTTVLGGKLVIEKELSPSRAVRLIEQHRIEAIFGVPLVYQALASAPEFAGADLESLRSAVVGGAAVPVALLQAWAAKNVALRQIYGMTEAGGIATSTPVHEFREHPDTCGRGHIFTEVMVVADDGTPAPAGQPGELVIRGPGVTPGYWDSPEVNAEVFRDGWLHSGDLGVTDEDGRIRFVDRLKDLIITGGINVSPVELEQVVDAIDGIAESVVIAVPDPKFGETPAVIAHAAPGVSEADVVAACSEVLADFKVPRYVVLREEPLPRLPSGKISRTAVREQYAGLTEQYAKVR